MQKLEGEWARAQRNAQAGSPHAEWGEPACSCAEETLVSFHWCLDRIGWRENGGAKLKRRLCRPLERSAGGRTTDSLEASERFPSCALKAARGLQAVENSAKMGVIDLLSPASGW